MAEDARALLDRLAIPRADVMGYSMGARIAAFLAMAHPKRVRSAVLGGLGDHLVDGAGLPIGLADAMEAPSAAVLTDPTQKMFRQFAEATKSDLAALAACIRGARQTLSEAEVGRINLPILVAVGTEDDVAGDPERLAAMFPAARALEYSRSRPQSRGGRQGLQTRRPRIPGGTALKPPGTRSGAPSLILASDAAHDIGLERSALLRPVSGHETATASGVVWRG